MTHPASEFITPGSPPLTPHGPAWQGLFALAEVEAFHQDDRKAAASIVILMAGIFTIGLLGYIGVCLWVL
jgi:hypothetical protein